MFTCRVLLNEVGGPVADIPTWQKAPSHIQLVRHGLRTAVADWLVQQFQNKKGPHCVATAPLLSAPEGT